MRCRVYKNYDPRAKIIKDVAEDVFKITGRNPLIDIAKELEKIARSDDYFVSRKLYPNVDFYSGRSKSCSPSIDFCIRTMMARSEDGATCPFKVIIP